MTASAASGRSALANAPRTVLSQAAHWFALLRSGEATAADQAAWQTWLEEAESHRAAWARVEQIGRHFQPIQATADPQSAVGAYRAATGRAGRRRLVLGLAAGAGLAGWVGWHQSPMPGMVLAWQADHRSATGEVRTYVLSDGTQVWLGTASAFNDDYNDQWRRLHLIAGELLIDTATDAARPFVVDTPHGRMQALGTRFMVRLQHDESRLAVFEGAVRITPADGASVTVPAGQQVRVSSRGVSAMQAVDPASASSARGIFIARNLPLRDFLQELQRYRIGWLDVSPAVASLPVFGSYPMTDPERTLAMLEAVLPVRVRRPLPGWIRVGAP